MSVARVVRVASVASVASVLRVARVTSSQVHLEKTNLLVPVSPVLEATTNISQKLTKNVSSTLLFLFPSEQIKAKK